MAPYKIKEASDITGLSQQVIYKYLDYFSTIFNGSVKSVDGVTALTEEGLHLLEKIKSRKDTSNTRLKDVLKSFQKDVEYSKESVEKTEASIKNTVEAEIWLEQISYLKEQLDKKDEQIAELHQIIALQERNSLGQQKLLEYMSGKSLWKRLKTAFGLKNPHRSDTGF